MFVNYSMKQTILSLLCLSQFIIFGQEDLDTLASTNLSIENQIIKRVRSLDDTQKLMYYQENKKKPELAIVLSALVPTSGHAYLGNWGRGVLFLLPVLGTTMLMTQEPGEQIGEIIASGIIMHLLQIVDSALQTNKYNKELYKKLFLEFDFIDKEVIPKSRGSIGFGTGQEYGLVGLNIDYMVIKNLHITASFGKCYAGSTSNYGIKYYLMGIERKYRPMLTVLYGTNQEYRKSSFYDDDDIYEKFDGLTFGIGMQRMFGKSKQHGLDISFMYLATSGAFEYAENEGIGSPPNIGLSLGYRYGF